MVQGSFKELQLRDLLKKLGVVLLLFAGFSYAQLLDKVVANVNGEPILESELKIARMFYKISDRYELLKKLVNKHLIAQFLQEQGLNIPEGYIDSLIKEMAKSNGKTIEEFYRELYREGLSPKDLRRFLKIEVASTLGLNEYLRSKVSVSELEIELERLRSGDITYKKEIELLVINKESKDKILPLVEKYGADLETIAKELNEKLERMKVGKGELIEVLDREIWRTEEGKLAIAEDEEHLYLAKVLRTVRIISGRSEDEIREELLTKKLKEEQKRLLEKLKKKSLIEFIG